MYIKNLNNFRIFGKAEGLYNKRIMGLSFTGFVISLGFNFLIRKNENIYQRDLWGSKL